MVRLFRLLTTVGAGALVLAPAIRAGLDSAHQLQPSAVAAESPRPVDLSPVRVPPARAALAPARNTEDRQDRVGDGRVGDASDVGDDGSKDVDRTVAPLAAPQRFGFGPLTPFHPSDSPRELVLSFDDGPDLKFTPIVLDELDRRGLKAIFFVTGHRVVGDRAEDLARRELLRKIASRGHLVANHTMTHRNLCQFPDEAAAEIDANAEVIAQATGIRPPLFRAPYGARCHRLEAELATRRLVSVGWNLDPQDWRNPTSEDILAYLIPRLSRLEGRGVLLLHDTHPASVFALGPLLDWIARENRRAVDAGQAPIVLRDYAVFLGDRPVPATGLERVLAGVADRMRLPSVLGRH